MVSGSALVCPNQSPLRLSTHLLSPDKPQAHTCSHLHKHLPSPHVYVLLIDSFWSQFCTFSLPTWQFILITLLSACMYSFLCMSVYLCLGRGQWEWWVCKRVTASLFIAPHSSPLAPSRNSVEIPAQLFWSDLHKEPTPLNSYWQLKDSHAAAFKEALHFRSFFSPLMRFKDSKVTGAAARRKGGRSEAEQKFK